jgi:hypothetical protein
MATFSQRRSAERGTIMIEVLMALLPLLFSFLGVIQLAIFLMGKMVVQHAAGRAVRSAVVVLDDDPEKYGGAKRYDLEDGDSGGDDGLLALRAEEDDKYSALLGTTEVQGGARLQAIRQAAYHPLSVLAPNVSAVFGSTNLKDEIAASPWLRMGLYALAYNRGAASVTVELESGGPVTDGDYRVPVVVRVHYLLACGVPLVSRIMCHGGYDLLQARLGVFPDPEATEIVDNLKDVASPLLRDMIFTGGGRFMLLSAEAVLPNQGAPYH